MFIGESLPQSSRGGSPIRLQTTEIQDVRVRGLRAHHPGARGPLPSPQGEPSLLPGTSQVL